MQCQICKCWSFCRDNIEVFQKNGFEFREDANGRLALSAVPFRSVSYPKYECWGSYEWISKYSNSICFRLTVLFMMGHRRDNSWHSKNFATTSILNNNVPHSCFCYILQQKHHLRCQWCSRAGGIAGNWNSSAPGSGTTHKQPSEGRCRATNKVGFHSILTSYCLRHTSEYLLESLSDTHQHRRQLANIVKHYLLMVCRVRAMLASRACRTSIMIGKALQKQTMYTILEHLSVLHSPWNCPHGRPTMRHLCVLPGHTEGPQHW